MERFVVANQIESFEQLQEFKTQREPAYEKLSAERQQLAEQIARLEQLLVAYSDYEPYIVYHKTSNSLKGFAKRKYDKEHETELREYDSYRAKLRKCFPLMRRLHRRNGQRKRQNWKNNCRRAIPTMQEWLRSLRQQRLLSITIKCLP